MSQQTHRKTFFLVWSDFILVVFSTLKCEILFAQRKISGFVFKNVFKLTLIKSMAGGFYKSHVQVAPADRSELSRGCQSLSFSFVIGISLLTSEIGPGSKAPSMTSALSRAQSGIFRSFWEILRLDSLQGRPKVPLPKQSNKSRIISAQRHSSRMCPRNRFLSLPLRQAIFWVAKCALGPQATLRNKGEEKCLWTREKKDFLILNQLIGISRPLNTEPSDRKLFSSLINKQELCKYW